MKKILKHVGIIMDGNRRWARERNLPVFEGHRVGEQKIEPIIDKAILIGISHLTFWAFSTENWKRNEKEIHFLLNLFRIVLEKKISIFHEKNVKLNIIGDISKFPKDIRLSTAQWMEKTRNNKKITVNIALNYGGRDEIIRAISKMRSNSNSSRHSGIHDSVILKNSGTESGQFPISNFDNSYFNRFLDTAGQPDPELIIRTGGVKRLSGFMLWQSEYSELYFSDLNWPDFSVPEFEKAIDYYTGCQRRFGG
jgi:undecaprenyl diphosphate synthase